MPLPSTESNTRAEEIIGLCSGYLAPMAASDLADELHRHMAEPFRESVEKGEE
jgi:hypothetical protein